MKRIIVDLSATLLHHGHVRLLKKAKELGYVIVALTTDDEVEKHKGYKPELKYAERREILLALRYVDEVVPSPWLLDESFIQKHQGDLLVHGSDNSNEVRSTLVLERTEGISTSEIRVRSFAAITEKRNSEKILLTPGPSNLHAENLFDLVPAFTRGDEQYNLVANRVLENIRRLAGQDSIVALQGSATTAIEIATTNFLTGRVLVVVSGYYSQRILTMLELKKDKLQLDALVGIAYEDLLKTGSSLQKFDWLVAVYTETADAFLTDMSKLKKIANDSGAFLMVDATGSINLERDHHLADVCLFSSCKGLGGLTGAGFITFNQELLNRLNKCQKEFILDIFTYKDKKTTGPVHALSSLSTVSDQFAKYSEAVAKSKRKFLERFGPYVTRQTNQPNLCTMLTAKTVALPPSVVSYSPRSIEPGHHVICHLFDQFPSNLSDGALYDLIEVSD